MDNQPNQQPVQPQPQYQPPVMPPQQQFNQPLMQPTQPVNNPGKGLAIAGFVMAFVGLGLVGIILSIIGLSKSKKAGQKNGLAVAGIILNVISIIMVSLLMSITLVSYAGITARAKTSQASSNALSIKTCAELYYYENEVYPDEASDFTETSYSCSVPLTDTLNKDNGSTSIKYQYSGNYGTADGGKITYWDYSKGEISDYVLYPGDTDESSTFRDIQ